MESAEPLHCVWLSPEPTSSLGSCEIAVLLKLSQSQVYALIDCAKIRVHRFTTKKNGGVRISQQQLDDVLQATETQNALPASVKHLRL